MCEPVYVKPSKYGIITSFNNTECHLDDAGTHDNNVVRQHEAKNLFMCQELPGQTNRLLNNPLDLLENRFIQGFENFGQDLIDLVCLLFSQILCGIHGVVKTTKIGAIWSYDEFIWKPEGVDVKNFSTHAIGREIENTHQVPFKPP